MHGHRWSVLDGGIVKPRCSIVRDKRRTRRRGLRCRIWQSNGADVSGRSETLKGIHAGKFQEPLVMGTDYGMAGSAVPVTAVRHSQRRMQHADASSFVIQIWSFRHADE